MLANEEGAELSDAKSALEARVTELNQRVAELERESRELRDAGMATMQEWNLTVNHTNDALRAKQDSHSCESEVLVQVFTHNLYPPIAKFALAHSTRSGGVSVEVGESSGLRPCAVDSGDAPEFFCIATPRTSVADSGDAPEFFSIATPTPSVADAASVADIDELADETHSQAQEEQTPPMEESIKQAFAASQNIDSEEASIIAGKEVAAETELNPMSVTAADRLPKKELASRMIKFQETSQGLLDESSLDLIVSYYDELIEVLGARSLQQRLTDIANKQANQQARLELLMQVWFKLAPRYGFEASLQGYAQLAKMANSLHLALERQSRSQSSEQVRLVLERWHESAWLCSVGSIAHRTLLQGWEPKRQLIHDDESNAAS